VYKNYRATADSEQTVCGTERTKVKQRLLTVGKVSVGQNVTKVKQKLLTVGKVSVVRIFAQVHTFMSDGE
jgi:hypothetical protein